jgi:hypothetical protein
LYASHCEKKDAFLSVDDRRGVSRAGELTSMTSPSWMLKVEEVASLSSSLGALWKMLANYFPKRWWERGRYHGMGGEGIISSQIAIE